MEGYVDGWMDGWMDGKMVTGSFLLGGKPQDGFQFSSAPSTPLSQFRKLH